MKTPRTFRLTDALVAAHSGSNVVCLAPRAVGQVFRLHARRPDASTNRRVRAHRADIVDPSGNVIDLSPESAQAPALTVVDVCGVIEQRAGYHDMCAGWTDGHDAICERMCEALIEGDVLMVFDSPGGACAGLQEAVRRVQECKAQYGRRVTGFVDELCGSAAYWWGACVCDEIYAPPAAFTGSIGARSGHASIAGMLANEGVEVTFFTWPGPGKVALAEEHPLSDVGRERAERDTRMMGEAFGNAVQNARGIALDTIVELDADVLMSSLALDAKLIDGVASYEDVLDYCLTQAENAAGDSDMPDENTNEKNGQATRSSGNLTAALPVGVRVEDDEPSMSDDEEKPESQDEDEPKKGKEPDSICGTCGMQNEKDSKYCDQCGASMEAPPMAEDDSDDEEGDKPGSKSKSEDPPSKPDEARTASLAQVFGLPASASPLAIKSAALRMRAVIRSCIEITGAKSMAELPGTVKAHAEDAEKMSEIKAENKSLKRAAQNRERVALLQKLAAANLPGYSRGELLVDEVDDRGTRTVKPSPVYAEMKLATLRGFVEGKLRNASKSTATVARDPFQPSRERAENAQTSALVDEASRTPLVQRIAEQSSAKPETIAAVAANLFGPMAVQSQEGNAQ